MDGGMHGFACGLFHLFLIFLKYGTDQEEELMPATHMSL